MNTIQPFSKKYRKAERVRIGAHVMRRLTEAEIQRFHERLRSPAPSKPIPLEAP